MGRQDSSAASSRSTCTSVRFLLQVLTMHLIPKADDVHLVRVSLLYIYYRDWNGAMCCLLTAPSVTTITSYTWLRLLAM